MGSKPKPIVSSSYRIGRSLAKVRLSMAGKNPTQDNNPVEDLLGEGVATGHYRESVMNASFRWSGNDCMLVPKLLLDGEMPNFKGSQRQIINLVAEGKPFTGEVGDKIRELSGEQLADAIKEGISRWHTFKEGE